ncbi:MAG: hypothetical protein II535_02810 [Bacteroidales bacterium]|nr:hypothetical protein [Bacteroidales bacterium]
MHSNRVTISKRPTRFTTLFRLNHELPASFTTAIAVAPPLPRCPKDPRLSPLRSGPGLLHATASQTRGLSRPPLGSYGFLKFVPHQRTRKEAGRTNPPASS